MVFYALEEFREWSLRMAEPALRPLARKAFLMITRHRVNVLDWLGLTDREAIAVFGRVETGTAEASASGLQKIHRMIGGEEPREVRSGR